MSVDDDQSRAAEEWKNWKLNPFQVQICWHLSFVACSSVFARVSSAWGSTQQQEHHEDEEMIKLPTFTRLRLLLLLLLCGYGWDESIKFAVNSFECINHGRKWIFYDESLSLLLLLILRMRNCIIPSTDLLTTISYDVPFHSHMHMASSGAAAARCQFVEESNKSSLSVDTFCQS